MNKPHIAALLLAGTFLGTAACSDGSANPAGTTTSGNHASVLFLGDSVAEGEALPLTAAFKTTGVDFTSIAADGGGNVVGPFADKNWADLPGRITAVKPTVLVYQITTYDWGTEAEQKAAYRKLVDTASGDGAKVVFVTMPPIKPDDFYRPHMADLTRTGDVAKSVAAASAGKATVLDSTEVWGPTYQQTKDGRKDRSEDGIHTCPQGAARFTNWLLNGLTGVLPGFTPPAAETWANAGWAGDKRFQGC